MKQQSKFKYWMGLLALGYMGGTMFIFQFIRFVFYDQMIELMACTNTQLGMLNTAASVMNALVAIPGAYYADKWDAKHTIVRSIGAITLLTFLFPLALKSYPMALLIFALQPIARFAYWPSLIKYINGLNGEDSAGSSFGIYYLINGLSGAIGNVLPLWVAQQGYGMIGAIIAMGGITLVATVLVAIFLDSEKTMATYGKKLKGDDPIEPRHIKYVLKWPGTYMLALASITTYTIYTNVSYFNPFVIDVFGVDPDASSGYSIIRSYGAMLVAPFGGFMADKVLKSTSSWYILTFAISAVMFLVPLMFGADSNQTVVLIYSVIPSIVVFALYAVTFSIIRELHIPATVAGTAIGIATLPANITDALWPTLFGGFLDNYGNFGYTLIFVVLAVNCIVGALNAVWVKSHDKKCLAGTRKLDLSGLNK